MWHLCIWVIIMLGIDISLLIAFIVPSKKYITKIYREREN